MARSTQYAITLAMSCCCEKVCCRNGIYATFIQTFWSELNFTFRPHPDILNYVMEKGMWVAVAQCNCTSFHPTINGPTYLLPTWSERLWLKKSEQELFRGIFGCEFLSLLSQLLSSITVEGVLAKGDFLNGTTC